MYDYSILQTIGQAISDWYFDRNNFEMIDAQHDIPISTMDRDTSEGDEECAATLSLNSVASHHIVNIICIVMQSLISLMFYLNKIVTH